MPVHGRPAWCGTMGRMTSPLRMPGNQKRLGEPWIYFSRRDKIYSLLAIIGIFVIINIAFGELGTDNEGPTPTTTVVEAEG